MVEVLGKVLVEKRLWVYWDGVKLLRVFKVFGGELALVIEALRAGLDAVVVDEVDGF
jgi:hypothetical protein